MFSKPLSPVLGLIAVSQGITAPLAEASFSQDKIATDPITSSASFRNEVDRLVTRVGSRPHQFVYFDRGGAAWRGETTKSADPLTIRAIVPPQLREGNCRYVYIGLEQYSTRRTHHNSDLGLAINYQVERAIPFVTTKDPSLVPSKATILVWKRTGNQVSLLTDTGKLSGSKYYTIKKDSPLFYDATFAPGEQVDVSLARGDGGKFLILSFKSSERTVTIRIPRDASRISQSEKLQMHPVAAATVSSAKARSTSKTELLVASTEVLPADEIPTYPLLHAIYSRVTIAMNGVGQKIASAWNTTTERFTIPRR